MPGLSFTLPHWLYWVSLIAFPLIAMVLARRPKRTPAEYSVPLAYAIWLAGGFLGLHRFYLKSMLGFVYLPLFLFVLYANGQEGQARGIESDYLNQVRAAERVIAREEPRVATAREELESLSAAIAETEEGSFARRSAERRLERAQGTIETGQARLDEAQASLGEIRDAASVAQERRTMWDNAAGYTFYAIIALMLIDATRIPFLVGQANVWARLEPEEPEPAHADDDDRKADEEYATNWIDRLSLFAGEFTAYWAVIAVLVYYYEVIARYVFNSPTNWAHEGMYLMFGMQYLIAGSYAMLTETHVRVDIFYANWSKRRKAWVDLFTSVFFFIFAGTLLITSYIFAMDAIAVPTGNGVLSMWARGEIPTEEMIARFDLVQITDPAIRWGEISFNEWEVPLWPMKWVMVVGGLLLVLQGVSKLAKDIREVTREH